MEPNSTPCAFEEAGARSMEDRSTDIGSDRSPIGTPTMNTRGLNTQPVQRDS